MMKFQKSHFENLCYHSGKFGAFQELFVVLLLNFMISYFMNILPSSRFEKPLWVQKMVFLPLILFSPWVIIDNLYKIIQNQSLKISVMS